ncbi:helix-turn-helix domain-containing protein, partial [Microbacterium sp.]|uniref:helix-turn-helix domain-containing protein n=1 Tax=Microbacterium sp. TaxID=51671 RepID=UPI002D768154
MPASSLELATLGHRIRHQRVNNGLTLDELGARVGVAGSQLSLIENGKREPKLSLLQAIADVTGVQVADLLSPEPPNRRAALELELQRAQASPVFRRLGIPPVRITKSLSDETIESILGLHRELQRREREAIATPEEARRANNELRLRMRERDNYLPDIEKLAEKQLKAAGHVSGALTHRTVSVMAEQLGFELIYVSDLPHSARSVTDLENGRIYLPPASIPGGHGLRSMALQAMAHRLLGHTPPTDYADFLQQRLEINYYAACCLMPETNAVAFLQQAKKDRNLAVEDFRDAFGVTHEAAGMRMTNLLTHHLGIRLHFLRVDGSGAITRVYENDDLPLPSDVTGSVDGQIACRRFAARAAFAEQNRTTEYYQYTDTPSGTFWCSTQTGTTSDGEFSITVGVPFDDAKWFRGRETGKRAVSTCPDESCCRRPPDDVRNRWEGKA